MLRLILVLTTWAAVVAAAPVFVAVGSDSITYVPNQLVWIDAGLGTVSSPVPLGSGDTGYAGGLAPATGGHYIIESDGLGNTTLRKAAPGGTLTTLFSLFPAQWGGLAMAGTTLYGIRLDEFGESYLVQFDLGAQTAADVFTLNGRFDGGLAYNTTDGALYAVANHTGTSVLHRLNLGTQDTTAQAVDLSFALFNGGLAWDAAGGRFYGIGNDYNFDSTLYRFSATNVDAFSLALGAGFAHAALSVTEEDAPTSSVPEPSSMALVGLGLLAVARLSAREWTSRDSCRSPRRWWRG